MTKKPNAFKTAETVTVDVKKPGEKKNAKAQVAMGADLDEVARIDALVKALEGRKKAAEGRLKAKILEAFIVTSANKGERPDNFVGVGAVSTASCENRKRSTASALTDEEVEIITKAGLPIGEEVSLDIPGRFFFNEEVLALGDAVLEKISSALGKIKELDGIDVIKYQAPQKTSKPVVTDETIAELCKTRDISLIGKLAPMVTVQALKAKLNDGVTVASMFEEMRRAFATATGTDEQPEPKEI